MSRLVVRDERDPVAEDESADDGVDVASLSERDRVGILHRVDERCPTGGERLHRAGIRDRPGRPQPIGDVDAAFAATQPRNARLVERNRRLRVLGHWLASTRGNQLSDGLLNAREMLENFRDRPSSVGGSPIAVSGGDACDCGEQPLAFGVQEFERCG